MTAIYYALARWQLVDRSKKQPRCEIRAKSQGGREGESRTKDKLRGLNSIHLYSLLCSPNKLFFYILKGLDATALFVCIVPMGNIPPVQ